MSNAIILRSISGKIENEYSSIKNAADDLLIEEADILESIKHSTIIAGLGRFYIKSSFEAKCTNRGKHKHPETSIPVVQISTVSHEIIREFNSIYEAYMHTGARNITRCCKGQAKTSGGYIWAYKSSIESDMN